MIIGLLLSAFFTLVELNCENLFDLSHDTLHNDHDFLPEGAYHWNASRYWRKLNRIGQEIISCGGEDADWELPDLVALCEVENDSVMRDLTRRSLLRTARYEYVMTNSPDERGIDVALMYSPFSFSLLNYHSIRVSPVEDMHPTRDILYVSGLLSCGDTLHVFVIHAPSRSGGERATRPHRLQVARCLAVSVDSVYSIHPEARILVTGDFNDYSQSKSLQFLSDHELIDISSTACGSHGAKGTYRYRGQWGSLDHILASPSMADMLAECFIHDPPFLFEDDEKYGGVKPRRTFLGPRYLNVFSDHLPLLARFRF